MTFLTTRLKYTWKALRVLARQALMLLDQACNALVLGLAAVFMALITGEEQAECYADETLSAHAYRAAAARKRWASFFQPAVDWMFSWQKPLPEVDAGAGRPITAHCERAFWKKKLRLYLPPEYRG